MFLLIPVLLHKCFSDLATDCSWLSIMYFFVCYCVVDSSRREPVTVFGWFNPTTFLCLSQARTWISISTYLGLFVLN